MKPEVQQAVAILMMHGKPVTEEEFRGLMKNANCPVSAAYLMMLGYLRVSEQGLADWWGRGYELTSKALVDFGEAEE